MPKPVDIVLVVDTYHHLPNRPAYFRELTTSLAAGGRVAISDFRKDSPERPPPQFRFDAEQIIGEIEAGGLPARCQVRFSTAKALPGIPP